MPKNPLSPGQLHLHPAQRRLLDEPSQTATFLSAASEPRSEFSSVWADATGFWLAMSLPEVLRRRNRSRPRAKKEP